MAQERGHAVIQSATCWEELHAGLDAAGLRFVRKGSGAVIFVGDTAVKASSVDRNFGMSKLCKRLGEFKPGFYSDGHSTSPLGADQSCLPENGEYQRAAEAEEEKHNAREREGRAKRRQSAREGLQHILPGTGMPVLPSIS
ncbi:MAG: hypothetical protein ACLRWP_16275 [Bilophila wadsworthia]